MLSAPEKKSVKLLLTFGYDGEVAKKIVTDYPELVAQIQNNPELGKPITVYRGITKAPPYISPNQESGGEFLGKGTAATLFTAPNLDTAAWYATTREDPQTPSTIIEFQIPKFLIDGYVNASLGPEKKMIQLSTLSAADRNKAISDIQGPGNWEILFDLSKLKKTFTFTKRIAAVARDGIDVGYSELYTDVHGANRFFWLPMDQLSISPVSPHYLLIPDAIRSKLKSPRLYWWQPVE